MKLAIMQPYFLPYIGYFQLISSVDRFIYYDDVNYIKGGWINRNRILNGNQDFMFTLELFGASSFKKINEIQIRDNRNKLKRTFVQSYSKAPYFSEIGPLLETIFNSNETNLSAYIIEANSSILNYLSIETEIEISSKLTYNRELKGQDKVIELCKNQKADTYINSIGGQDLYSREIFKQNEIELKFLKTKTFSYSQKSESFIQYLSIIDVLMFNPKKTVIEFLNSYDLL
jgi:hypothetical protein